MVGGYGIREEGEEWEPLEEYRDGFCMERRCIGTSHLDDHGGYSHNK